MRRPYFRLMSAVCLLQFQKQQVSSFKHQSRLDSLQTIREVLLSGGRQFPTTAENDIKLLLKEFRHAFYLWQLFKRYRHGNKFDFWFLLAQLCSLLVSKLGEDGWWYYFYLLVPQRLKYHIPQLVLIVRQLYFSHTHTHTPAASCCSRPSQHDRWGGGDSANLLIISWQTADCKNDCSKRRRGETKC